MANIYILDAVTRAAGEGERMSRIIKWIECRMCDAVDCAGCNVYQLEQALKSGAFRRFFVNGSIDIDAMTDDRLEYLRARVQEEIDRCNIVSNQLVLKKVLEWIEEARHG